MNTEILNSMIAELDQNHNESLASQEVATGTNLEVHNIVAQRMTDQNKYQMERRKLVELRNDSMPLSKGVEAFLKPKITEGKMDVLAGTAKIDTSLATDGKQVGKQI